MISWLVKPLDRLAIRMASAAMAGSSRPCPGDQRITQIPDPLLPEEAPETPSLKFLSEQCFAFQSSVVTPWPANNLVHGRLFPGQEASQGKPTVLLLHGWNAEHCYYYQFPWLAGHLARRGIGTVDLVLPYHCQRRPRGPGVIRDFISSDLGSMIQAVQQAVADARALVKWLSSTGRGPVVVWGFSLGAWLAGLIASAEAHLGAAILTTPIAQMERAIQDLAFCAPVRNALQGASISLAPFSLTRYRPVLPLDRVLIMAGRFDQFVPLSTLEELREAWNGPLFWRLPHSHISILMALPTLVRTIAWIGQSLGIQSSVQEPLLRQARPDSR